MKITKFFKKKNKIIKKYTGEILVPKDQIKDIPNYLKDLEKIGRSGKLSMAYDGAMCPYCVYYGNINRYNNEKINNDYYHACQGCPMFPDNYCDLDTSSYKNVIRAIKPCDTLVLCKNCDNYREMYYELETLVKKFNKTLERDYENNNISKEEE